MWCAVVIFSLFLCNVFVLLVCLIPDAFGMLIAPSPCEMKHNGILVN